MRSGLAKKREKEKLDGNERREIGNRSLKSSHIFLLQTEEPQKAPASSGLHQNYLGDVKPSGIMRNFCGRLPPPHQAGLAGWLLYDQKNFPGIEYQEISSASLSY